MQEDGTLINIDGEAKGDASTSFQIQRSIVSDSSSETSSDEFLVPISDHRTISFHSEKDMFKSDKLPNINLLELLSKAPMGKKITTYYDMHNILSASLRNKLVDIIFTELFDFHCQQ